MCTSREADPHRFDARQHLVTSRPQHCHVAHSSQFAMPQCSQDTTTQPQSTLAHTAAACWPIVVACYVCCLFSFQLVGAAHHASALVRVCMTSFLMGRALRRSYSAMLRSPPVVANTSDSACGKVGRQQHNTPVAQTQGSTSRQ